MVFVNEPFMYSFVLWTLTMAGAFLLFGNLQRHDPKAPGDSYRSSKRWFLFVSVQLILLIPAGMYVNSNNFTITNLTASSAKNLLMYQGSRNLLMFFKFAFAFGVLVMTQVYKRNAKNDPDAVAGSILHPENEVQGYEQMSVHFNSQIGHYFNGEFKLLMEVGATVYFLADFMTMFVVILHQYAFSDVGVSTWIQWWEYTTAICGIFTVFFAAFMRLGKNAGSSQSVFYSPESAVGHDHPFGSKADGNVGIHTLRVLNVKIPPYVIITYSLVEIAFGYIFFNDFGNLLLWVLIVVIFPHMMTAMVRTHSAWFQFHLFALVSYGNAFFFMPALNVMRDSAGSRNRFIPGSAMVSTTLTLAQDGDRHFMLPQEYNNTDQMYRTDWITDYDLTALSQGTIAVYVLSFAFLSILSGLVSLGRFGNRFSGIVQRPSDAERKYFAPIQSYQAGVIAKVLDDPMGA